LYYQVGLFVEVPAVFAAADHTMPAFGASSAVIAAQVQAACKVQTARFKKLNTDAYARVKAHDNGKLIKQIVTG
jgi:hypothetical protein